MSDMKKIISGRTTALFVAVCWMAYSFSYIGRLNFSASMAEMTNSGVLLKSLVAHCTQLYELHGVECLVACCIWRATRLRVALPARITPTLA